MNWVEDGDRFLLLLDSKLKTADFVGQIIRRWHLPSQRTGVMIDPHYRTSMKI